MPATRIPAIVASFLTGVAISACETPQQSAPSAEVRDSAGIHIITHPEAAFPPTASASLDTADLIIGDPASGVELFRVVGALRLSDGGLVIANAGAPELLFLDASGAVTRRVGREGSGPGEFGRLNAIRRLAGDTLLAWDNRLYRVTLFSPTGDLVSEISLGEVSGRLDERADLMSPIGRAPNGDLVVPIRLPHSHQPEDGPGQDTVHVVTITTDGQSGPSLLDVEGRATQTYRTPPPQQFMTVWVAPYAVGPSIHLLGDTLYTHDASPGIRLYTTAGDLATILRGGYATRPFTQALRDRFAADSASRGEMWTGAMELAGFPEALPAFTRAHVGADRTIWAEWPVAPGDTARYWSMFEGNSAPGIVSGPVGGRVMDVGSDWVLLLTRDSLDVERIELRALREHRPSP